MGKDTPNGEPHTIDDHMFGDFYPHDHEGDADHDHDDVDPGPLEDNPIWQRDNVMLTSVGIDIGSAGTQVVFSKVHLQRVGSSLASKYVIVDRRTVFESDISFTPFSSETTIDAAALGALIDDAYNKAHIRAADIDAGVVILTGEALRRENSEEIGRIIAEKGGDFVTATAGNHMEAMLAAYGSGAAKTSHDTDQRILNVDIGGGTTKLAICESGRVIWTGALHIGGRLIATRNDTITRLDPAGRHHAQSVGIEPALNDQLNDEQMHTIATHMAQELVAAITMQPLPENTARLFLTDVPTDLGKLDGIIFSGGVGEYIAGRETRSFGDLGKHLGQTIRNYAEQGQFNAPMLPAASCIRATALGASEYSVQLSGQTSTITSPGKILPRRNLQVLKPYIDIADRPTPLEICTAVEAHFQAFDLNPADEDVALVFDFNIAPEYSAIRALAEGIEMSMKPRTAGGHPLYIIIDGDIAQTLGKILRSELGIKNDLLVIDGLYLRDFDYIDLGKIRLPSFTVPVTVKSLLFAEGPEGSRGKERIHFREDEGHRHTHSNHSHGHHHHDHSHMTKTTENAKSAT